MIYETNMISKSAEIAKSVEIGKNVTIGAFSLLEENVKIGNNCKISEHVIIRKNTILEDCVKIDSFSTIGGLPQDINFNENIYSQVKVCKNTVIREGVTIHRSTLENGITKIGENCYLMAQSHVAHDCILDESVILANAVLLGGFVEIGKHAFLGGSAVVHQFVKIGENAMIGGNACITRHIPPFTMTAERDCLIGLNLVGLKRRKFSQEDIQDIKFCFKSVYFPNNKDLVFAQNLSEAKLIAKTEHGKKFLSFFDNNFHNRNFVHPRNKK